MVLAYVLAPASLGKRGYETTFMIAYLRDFARTYHFLGESFETFVAWSKVTDAVIATTSITHKEDGDRCLPGRTFVGCRVTQIYHEGACLYFYFPMNFENVAENPSSIFSEIEHTAREEILRHGGSLSSHHHGVGKVRASFLKEVDSAVSLAKHDVVHQTHHVDLDNIFASRNGPFVFLS
jgi:alkyldihydroxyacetonephosphate synthase